MSDNPYLDSVPEELNKADFVQQIKSTPDFAGVPMDYMYTVYDLLLRAIRIIYLSITMLDTIRQIQGLRQEGISSFATEADLVLTELLHQWYQFPLERHADRNSDNLNCAAENTGLLGDGNVNRLAWDKEKTYACLVETFGQQTV